MFTELTIGAGTAHAVHATAIRCGKDLSVTLSGGTAPHIGAVALAVYEPERRSATVSVVTAYSHRDDRVAVEAARVLSAALGCTAAVAAGLHVDDATAEDIRVLWENSRRCWEELVSALLKSDP